MAACRLRRLRCDDLRAEAEGGVSTGFTRGCLVAWAPSSLVEWQARTGSLSPS